MNRRVVLAIVAALAVTGLAHADSGGQLSPERLAMMDKLGYFTPGFKAAVHDLVDTKHALAQAKKEQLKLIVQLPDLQKQATEAEANTAALQQELARCEHPEETDFDALQKQMNDAGAKLEDQIALAQAYVWTYPASPHEGVAQQYLEQTQKKLADQRQAEKDAEAARAAAYAKLVQRAQARDLSLNEWRNFLRDMSQEDLVKLLGRPTSQTGDYWIYSGEWILDPATNQKVGLEINFNAGRVLSVGEKPPSP
ncbi:MAG TPA: hypothetical protein VGZ93_00280 [Candidatus Methylacidiphilales bacterium]|jgi:chromosome segregation ATPase|nr:hypothetical protein [Candidatus Methylacidiphilales bacterium]